ncbi:MAG: DUF4843 domain-containing protein, partial [Chitinophagaceae bacterium]|nr:DUF4843 domain-containing protein [Chitinophagaceae bacterium]
TLNGEFVEIDATVLNNPASGKDFPLLTKIPADGRPVITTDANLTRTSGLVKLRVNLVAPQRGTAERLTYKVIPAETTAVAGTHYNISGTLEIPANSSFGYIEVQVLNPGPTTGTKDLVLELESNSSLKSNPNYNKVGLRIAQN